MNCKDLIIPQLNVNDNKVTIEDIRFENMEYINSGEILYTVATSKSVDDYAVDFSGFVVLYVEDGDEVNIGDSAGVIFKNKEDAETKMLELETKKTSLPLNVSKKALAYAKEINFDLNLIKKDGIIKVEDIDKFITNSI